MQKDNIIDNRYSIISKIGSGGFGVVYTVKDEQENGGPYAAKIFKILKGVDREIEILNILKDLHNPFIINIIDYSDKGTIIRNGKIFKDKKYCILEYAPKNNLLQYIDSAGKLKEDHCKFIFHKILKAINAIHSKGIYHLDIKPENILLDEHFEPKITDFGLSIKIDETKDGHFEGSRGTPNFMPPQMFLLGKQIFNPIKADIFSLGATLFNLAGGYFGFDRAKEKDFYYRYIKENTEKSIEKYWKKVETQKNLKFSDLFKKLYIKMVSFNEDNRPSIEDILNDEWFAEIFDEEKRKIIDQEFCSEFEKRDGIVKDNYQKIITNDTIDENIAKEEEADSNEEKYFDKQEATNEKEGMKMDYFIRIYRNLNPVNYMNKLINKIIFYETDCHIDASKKNLKFKIIFNAKDESDEDEDDDDDDEEKLILDNKRIYKPLIIEIKLFKAINGKYLLRFRKKEGDLSNFYYKLKKYMTYAQLPAILRN